MMGMKWLMVHVKGTLLFVGSYVNQCVQGFCSLCILYIIIDHDYSKSQFNQKILYVCSH